MKVNYAGMDLHVQEDGIKYSDNNFKHLSIREVMRNDESDGIYHINIFDKGLEKTAVNFLRNKLTDCEIGLISEEEGFNLDHNIYIKTEDPMRKESMVDFFTHFDQNFSAKLLNKEIS